MVEPRRVAFFGLFGVGNIGNEASLAAGLEAAERHGVDPIVVGADPSSIAVQHGVSAVAISMAGPLDVVSSASRPVRLMLRPLVEIMRWVVDLRFARTVDALVVPGTGILDDFGMAPHEMPYDLARWSTVARLARRPWIMVGVGAGPIVRPLSRWLIRRAVRNASLVTYRDEDSRAFMEGIGAAAPSDLVQPDVAFGLTRREARGGTRCIGLGLMAYYGWDNDRTAGEATLRTYIGSMVEVARRILAEGYSIRLLIGESSDSAAVNLFVESLRPELADDWERRITIAPIADFNDVLAQAALTDAIVATRYHNVVAGLMVSRPVVSIGYAAKFHQVMSTFGVAEHCHDVDRIDVDAVIDDLHSVLDDADAIVARLRVTNKRAKHAARASFDTIFVALNSVDDELGRDDASDESLVRARRSGRLRGAG